MALPSKDALLSARATLAQALLETNVRPSEEALYWLLGLVAGESAFGTSPDWTIPNTLNTTDTNPTASSGYSNNWGAVRWSTGPFIWHHDRDAQGKLGQGPGPEGSYKFQVMPSAVAGAKHFLGTLLQSRNETRGNPLVRKALSGEGTAHDLAAGMFQNGYYTGTTGSNDDRIQAYANMITSLAASIRSAVGAPSPSPGPSPTPTPGVAVDPKKVMLVGALVGTAAAAAWVMGVGPFDQPRFARKALSGGGS